MSFNDERPIFLQIAEQLEEGILSGAYPEESRIPSITEYSLTYKINPATALKGINLLVDSGLLYKKRGLGMFVSTGAKETLKSRRNDLFYRDYIKKLIREAKNLGLTAAELDKMIKRGFEDAD
ncbi:MAG: GntR family transcriptional regulator [Clostridiaceae bacterium]|nr:GntR family transcriptional regulator [Clostridiaceae bacterium]